MQTHPYAVILLLATTAPPQATKAMMPAPAGTLVPALGYLTGYSGVVIGHLIHVG
jgi:hypothetical protein